MRQELIKKCKFLSLILRHRPERAGLKLDEYGWIDIPTLLEGSAQIGKQLTLKELIEIVDTNEKKRFTICSETNRIRANQGHSLKVDLQLKQAVPPSTLYHGTTIRFEDSIKKEGIRKMNRHHVHLSSDMETAEKVGKRHGELLIFAVDTQAMQKDGHLFFISENKVWLTDSVPQKYLNTVTN